MIVSDGQVSVSEAKSLEGESDADDEEHAGGGDDGE